MTSKPLTTEITPVLSAQEEDNQNENCLFVDNSVEAEFSSDSDSDCYLEDNRYDIVADEDVISEEAIQVLSELFAKNKFNKIEIIQRKNDKTEVNRRLVSHSVLTDQKTDELKSAEVSNRQNSKYLFESKSKLLKDSKLKLQKKSDKIKKKLRTDLRINSIPKTFTEFLDLISDLKADLIEDEESKLFFGEETHNRDIRFLSHDSYIKSFVPFVIREFWSALKANTKPDLISYQMSFKERQIETEFVLSHIRHKSSNQSAFKYGQIVVIKYVVQLNQDSDDTEVLSYFGFVIDVTTELVDKTSDLMTDPLILSQTNEEDNEYIYESIFIYCKPLAQTFLKVSVTPLTCVQKYLLEARIVFELKEPKFEKIFKQILKPNYDFGNVGYSVNLEKRDDLFEIQKNSIQSAYALCCLPPMDVFSSFIAIYGGPKTGKTKILTEVALQLLKTADQKINKLLIITTGVEQLNEVIHTLKKDGIKVFHIDNEGKCLSHRDTDFRKVIRKMDEINKFDHIYGKDVAMKQIIDYYSQKLTITDLSIKDKYVKEIVDKIVVDQLISVSNVIIGSIASVMNNEAFNRIYNKDSGNELNCVLVDNCHLLTETELLTLLFSGVRSFALFGDISQSPSSYEKSESFLKRYVRQYLNNFPKTDSKDKSVLHLRETISSLQRLAKRQREQNDRTFNRFGRKNANQKIAEYQRTSNFGSEYFNKNRRFNGKSSFKIENKDGIKPKEADNKSFATYAGEREDPSSDLSHYNVSSSHGSNNPMIDGISSHFAYGNRDTYLSRFNTEFNTLPFTPPVHNRNSTFSSDLNADNYPTNGTEFMSNPTRHQNYNLF